MKKRAWSFTAMGVVLSLVSFPGFSGAAERVIKLGHVLDTKHPYHIGSEYFAKRTAELTKGKVEVQVYPSSQLGNVLVEKRECTSARPDSKAGSRRSGKNSRSCSDVSMPL